MSTLSTPKSQEPASTGAVNQAAITFTLDAEVKQPSELRRAALNRMTEDGSMTEDEALAFIEPNGVLDLGACVTAILDPGTVEGLEIISSSCDVMK